MLDLDAIREVLNDWALLIVSILGVVAAWDKAKRQLFKWWGSLNLWGRVHNLEVAVDDLQSVSNVEAHP